MTDNDIWRANREADTLSATEEQEREREDERFAEMDYRDGDEDEDAGASVESSIAIPVVLAQELMEALEPFSRIADTVPDDFAVWITRSAELKYFRRARTVHAKLKSALGDTE